MLKKLSHPICFLILAWTLAGCRIIVMVPGHGHGDVRTIDGKRDCDSGQICDWDIVSSIFSESFTAVPREGYIFSHWQKGNGYLCSGSTNPTCPVSFDSLTSQQALDLANSDAVGYLVPIFEFVDFDADEDGLLNEDDDDDDNDGLRDFEDSCPFDDDPACIGEIPERLIVPVLADGKRWIQPTLFVGLSWDEINAACPALSKVCPEGAALNGYNVSGWTWASLRDVTALFNFYIGRDELGPGPEEYAYIFDPDNEEEWAWQFDWDGWQYTDDDFGYYYYNGWASRSLVYPPPAGEQYLPYLSRNNCCVGIPEYAATDRTIPAGNSNIRWGAWFFREP